jgi:hypothetical protein
VTDLTFFGGMLTGWREQMHMTQRKAAIRRSDARLSKEG